MNSFYVINFDINRKIFEKYDVIPYLVRAYKELKKRKTLQNHYPLPTTFDEFKEFVKRESRYQFWCRCEYEIILKDWPCGMTEEKWDVHMQIMMNLDHVTQTLMDVLKITNK